MCVARPLLSAMLKSFLYLLHLPHTNLFKIGISDNPRRRVGRLCRTWRTRIALVETFRYEDARQVERFWHKTFAAFNSPIYGNRDGFTEWYQLDAFQILAFIQTNERCATFRATRLTRSVADEICMNKDEAAREIGISIRSLQRAVTAGKLSVTYKRGAHGKQEASYNPEEIARYKTELETETTIAAQPPSQALERIADRLESVASNRDIEVSHNITEQLSTVFRNSLQEIMRPLATLAAPVKLSEKLMLSLPEAAALSGVPVDKLRSAVNSGALKAIRTIGRGLGKVRRSDLENYVSKLK